LKIVVNVYEFLVSVCVKVIEFKREGSESVLIKYRMM